MNDHTFDTHVEKADTRYDGAFTIINKLFAQHLPERFTLINREEDLGIEGLRRAKLSYRPAFLQHKFTAIRLHPDELFCRQLWAEAFGDEEAFIDSFLMRYYSRRRMLTASCDGKPAAMLHLLPFETAFGPAAYIYGVATAAAYRHRGLATGLLQEAIRRAEAEGCRALFLIPTPGDNHLRAFYERLGFSGAIPTTFHAPDGFDFGTGTAGNDLAMIRPCGEPLPLPERIEATLAL